MNLFKIFAYLFSVEVLEANSLGNQVSLRLSDGSSVKADVVILYYVFLKCTFFTIG